MSIRCPKCGNTNKETIWEDNFWSGCNVCGWCASCENTLQLVKIKSEPEFDYAAWRRHYGYVVDEE